MNVGFIYGIRTYPPSTGGSVHGYQLSKGLSNLGHTLYSWWYDDGANPYCQPFRGRQLFRFLRTIDVLYLRIHWHELTRWHAPLQLLLRTNIPTVYEVNGLPHEILYHSKRTHELDKITASLCGLARRDHAAIGVSETIRKYLDEVIGFQNTFCIPNGSDPNLFEPAMRDHRAGKPLNVIWMGSTNAKWHDLDAIIEAAKILEHRAANVEFQIFGKAKDLPWELPPNVNLTPNAPYKDIARLINSADVGLHIWKNKVELAIDGSPLKIFDYMACGLALISQGDGQRNQIVEKYKNGIFTTGEATDIADKIQMLENDRALCRRLGENGRRAVIEYYNWDRVARDTEAVLFSVMDSKCA